MFKSLFGVTWICGVSGQHSWFLPSLREFESLQIHAALCFTIEDERQVTFELCRPSRGPRQVKDMHSSARSPVGIRALVYETRGRRFESCRADWSIAQLAEPPAFTR